MRRDVAGVGGRMGTTGIKRSAFERQAKIARKGWGRASTQQTPGLRPFLGRGQAAKYKSEQTATGLSSRSASKPPEGNARQAIQI